MSEKTSGLITTIASMLKVDDFHKDDETLLQDIINQLSEVPYIPYPVSLATVDIVPLVYPKVLGDEVKVILGRKPGQEKYQFLGGFRDPGETNVEAARREFHEEACLLVDLERFGEMDSIFVDDVRYKNTPHKITTNLCTVGLEEDEAKTCKAGDDIDEDAAGNKGELKQFTLTELSENYKEIIREIHIPLYESLFHV